jgi:hypothetical protein
MLSTTVAWDIPRLELKTAKYSELVEADYLSKYLSESGKLRPEKFWKAAVHTFFTCSGATHLV